jgi:HSP20 family molecular chaperone IbpA
MRGTTFEMMQEHVRAIHRALTGKDPPEPPPLSDEKSAPSPESVAQRFADLEAMARSIPSLAEHVPAFSFAPPVDVIGTSDELIVEIGVPGIDRGDVDVEVSGDTLIATGARSVDRLSDGRIYFHAEMPRGPFRRAVRLPQATSGQPRIEVEQGIVRIRLAKAAKSPPARA